MANKKPDGKQPPRTRLSLASRLLAGAVRGSLPVPPPDEPWRNQNSKGLGRGKKHK